MGAPPRAVVVGGGVTGVKTAGAFAELRDVPVGRDYPEQGRAYKGLELLDGASRRLSGFDPGLSACGHREF